MGVKKRGRTAAGPPAAKKKPPVRKTAQGALKPETGKKTREKQPATELQTLTKELQSLIPRLDAEGLRFLLEQTRVHLYNMQAEELNKAIPGILRAAEVPPDQASGKKLRIEGSESGSSFYLIYKGQWIMFSRDEIIHMMKVISAPASDLETREHLLNWFERERRDIFAAVPIADKFDSLLNEIITELRENFRIRTE
jgi:hypothetical protein